MVGTDHLYSKYRCWRWSRRRRQRAQHFAHSVVSCRVVSSQRVVPHLHPHPHPHPHSPHSIHPLTHLEQRIPSFSVCRCQPLQHITAIVFFTVQRLEIGGAYRPINDNCSGPPETSIDDGDILTAGAAFFFVFCCCCCTRSNIKFDCSTNERSNRQINKDDDSRRCPFIIFILLLISFLCHHQM